MDDIGLKAVTQLRKQLQVDAKWSRNEARGFTWWGGAYAQRIWADPCMCDDGIDLSRVHIETDLIHGGDMASDRDGSIAAMLQGMSLSGPIHDRKDASKWRLACSAYANEDNIGWLTPLLGVAAAFQAREAELMAPIMAGGCGGAPAMSPHPTSGKRTQRDDMLNLSDYAKSRSAPAMYAGGALGQAAGAVRRHPMVRDIQSSDTMLSLRLACGGPGASLVLNAGARHPNLGKGLLCLLSLPTRDHPNTVAEALRMNEREYAEVPNAWSFGSWCKGQIGLTHVAFFSDLTFRPGIHTYIVMHSLMRMSWAAGDAEDDDEPTASYSPSLADRLRRFLRR